jgi:hypothetical protein
MKRFVVAAVLLLLLLAGCRKQVIGPVGSTHIHSDFKVYLDGEEIDFAKREYMVRAPYVHVEGMNGDVIHVHATGVTIGDFFRTLGMKFSKDCFVLDKARNDKKKFCNEEGKTLKFYVNGEQNGLYGDYLIGDWDKILITYGSDSEEQTREQLESITDYAAKESSSGKTMRLG